jgi:hypothetical protein
MPDFTRYKRPLGQGVANAKTSSTELTGLEEPTKPIKPTESTKEIVQDAKNSLKPLESLSDQFSSAGQGVDYFSSRATIPSTEKIVQDAKEKFLSKLEFLSDKLGPDFKESLDRTVNDISSDQEPEQVLEKIEKLVEQYLQQAKKVETDSVETEADKVEEGFNTLLKNVTGNAQKLKKEIQKIVGDSEAADTEQSARENVKKNILNSLQPLSGVLGSDFKDALQKMVEEIAGDREPKQVLEDIKGFVKQRLQKAQGINDEIKEKAFNFLNQDFFNKSELEKDIENIVMSTKQRKDAKGKILNFLKPLNDALGSDFEGALKNEVDGITGDQQPEQVFEDIKKFVELRLRKQAKEIQTKKIDKVNKKFDSLKQEFSEKESGLKKEIEKIVNPKKRAIQVFVNRANRANIDSNSVSIELKDKDGHQPDTQFNPCEPTWPCKARKKAFNALIEAIINGKSIQWDARDASDVAKTLDQIQDNLLRYSQELPGMVGVLLILSTMVELFRLSEHNPVNDLNAAIKRLLDKSEDPNALAERIAKIPFQDTSGTKQAKTLGELSPQLFARYMNQPSPQQAVQQEKVNSNQHAAQQEKVPNSSGQNKTNQSRWYKSADLIEALLKNSNDPALAETISTMQYGSSQDETVGKLFPQLFTPYMNRSSFQLHPSGQNVNTEGTNQSRWYESANLIEALLKNSNDPRAMAETISMMQYGSNPDETVDKLFPKLLTHYMNQPSSRQQRVSTPCRREEETNPQNVSPSIRCF